MKIKRKTLDLCRLWVIRVVIFSTVFLVLYWYFVTAFFVITSYELVGVPVLSVEPLRKNLLEVSTHKRYKIWPSNKIFSYSKSTIQKRIVDTLPNTKKVTVSLRGLHTLRVSVIPFVPLFKQDAVHGITKEGVIYSEQTDLSAYPTLLIASSTLTTHNDQGIISSQLTDIGSEELLSLSSLIQKINSVVFIVSKVSIDEYGDVIFYDEREKSMFKFARSIPVTKVWSSVVSSIDTEPLKSKLEHEKNNLLYLDVRFGNKVFYKFTNSHDTVIIQTNVASSTSSTTPSH